MTLAAYLTADDEVQKACLGFRVSGLGFRVPNNGIMPEFCVFLTVTRIKGDLVRVRCNLHRHA